MSFYQFTSGFYQTLRQGGFVLTLDEYHLLLEAMQAGLGIENKARFVETCQLLWAKTPGQSQIVAEQFEEYYKSVMAIISPNPTAPTPEEQETVNASDTASEEDKGKDKSITESKKDGVPSPIDKDKPKNPSTSNTNGKKTYSTSNAPVIVFYPPNENNSETNGVDNHLHQDGTDYIHSPFILTNDYLPLSLRQMQQIWRTLRNYAANRLSMQTNWVKTVQQIAQQGVFIALAYKPQRINQTQLIILIDHHGSMTHYQTLAEQLIKSAKEQGGYANAKVYYTHNIPADYLFENMGHSQAVSIADMLAQCSPKHTVFLFFSDAGAARGLFNVQRIITTKRFVEKLRKQVHAMAWLNPMPKHRWENTSAELLKHLVPMFECSETDMEAAIKTLKIPQKR